MMQVLRHESIVTTRPRSRGLSFVNWGGGGGGGGGGVAFPICKGKQLCKCGWLHRSQKPTKRVNFGGEEEVVRRGLIMGGRMRGHKRKEKKKEKTPEFRSPEVGISNSHQVYYLCSYLTFMMGFPSLVSISQRALSK